MDDASIGRVIRALRIRRRWRQVDLGAAVGMSRAEISRIERGLLARVPLGTIRAVGEPLGLRVTLEGRWRGGELARLLSARHAALQNTVSSWLAGVARWTLAPEATFSIFGERGAIDLLAWHAPTRCLLVIELKTEIVDIGELLGTLDRKRRLAPTIARERGWDSQAVATWVVVSDSAVNRRRVRSHAAVLHAALPSDGRSIRPWVRSPSGPIAALSFWSDSRGGGAHRRLVPVTRVTRSGPARAGGDSGSGALPGGAGRTASASNPPSALPGGVIADRGPSSARDAPQGSAVQDGGPGRSPG